ncbi:zinc ribbon domain-containing protein [Scatolibacter rhodanostii]|uniref:zinc ribbon domain-containing protein n=1 Tax=Scatolibacter rhodanostii TaxID=2014781 RepID=UPI000C069779|nr:zinc ribbon domain-containing protein [Scatolibacter rhodanostii]
MGFIDDVVVNAKSAAEIVGKTAGKIVDVSKLKINSAEVNADIKEEFEALGRYVYENARVFHSDDVEMAAKMARIDVLKEQASSIQKELLDKQNKTSCPSCGKMSPVGVSFCSVCGTKLDTKDVAEAAPQEQPKTEEKPAEEKAAEDTNSTEE